MMVDALDGKPIEREVHTPFVIATPQNIDTPGGAEVHLQDALLRGWGPLTPPGRHVSFHHSVTDINGPDRAQGGQSKAAAQDARPSILESATAPTPAAFPSIVPIPPPRPGRPEAATLFMTSSMNSLLETDKTVTQVHRDADGVRAEVG